ncbi:MAG: hypothetical protein ACI90V_011158 [Bacillariaceae sp.]|jgi:hypothetical protein
MMKNMMIINEEQYPWLATGTTTATPSLTSTSNLASKNNEQAANTPPRCCNDWSLQGEIEINKARIALQNHGAAIFPNFITIDAINEIVKEMSSGTTKLEDQAYTTNTTHTPYLRDIDNNKYPSHSIFNHKTHTVVASTAYDELSNNSILKQLYNDPRLLHMVSSIVDNVSNNNNQEDADEKQENKILYLSNDPLGCCSVNVFRPNYYHGFHYDESEFSVTLMIQDASDKESGLFQYTDPIRTKNDNNSKNNDDNDNNDNDNDNDILDLALERTADAFREYDIDYNNNNPNGNDYDSNKEENGTCSTTKTTKVFSEHENENNSDKPPLPPPKLHTLDFRPGTLLVLAGSKSLHRVTKVNGNRNRLVAVLTFSRQSNFCNTQQTQKMFWGRSSIAISISLSETN